MYSTRRALHIAAALLVVASVVAPAATENAHGADDDKQFSWSFRCDGLGGVFPVDAATVRREGNIPPEFRLRGEDTGTATLFVAAFDCDPAVVDGASAPFLYALATVDLDPLGSHPGSYDFFKFTEDSRVHSRFERMGVWIRQLAHMSVDAPGADDLHIGAAQIPWHESPFSISAVGAPGAPVPDEVPSDHWSKGSLGTVYGADNNCEGRLDPALVTVDTTPETPLARILGGDATAPGAFLHLSAAAHVAFEGQTQRPTECPSWD